jgi:hypothetical protein
LNIEQIARVCHAANEVYCHSIGDHSQKPWDQAEDWQRQSAIKGVQFALANPEASPSALHESWLKEKEVDGWIYGPVKDVARKEHPCMVPYNDLPLEQRIKDYLFRAVVRAFVEAGNKTEP